MMRRVSPHSLLQSVAHGDVADADEEERKRDQRQEDDHGLEA